MCYLTKQLYSAMFISKCSQRSTAMVAWYINVIKSTNRYLAVYQKRKHTNSAKRLIIPWHLNK